MSAFQTEPSGPLFFKNFMASCIEDGLYNKILVDIFIKIF